MFNLFHEFGNPPVGFDWPFDGEPVAAAVDAGEFGAGDPVRQLAANAWRIDGVGIALEDYSALRLTYELATQYGIGTEADLTPTLADPKDLVALLQQSKVAA